jgi:hypothetical protein
MIHIVSHIIISFLIVLVLLFVYFFLKIAEIRNQKMDSTTTNNQQPNNNNNNQPNNITTDDDHTNNTATTNNNDPSPNDNTNQPNTTTNKRSFVFFQFSRRTTTTTNNNSNQPLLQQTNNNNDEINNSNNNNNSTNKKRKRPKEMRYYELLQVDFDATDKDLNRAYKKQALKLHPDKPTGDANKFVEMKRAYDVLSDAKKRDIYDTRGERYLQFMEEEKIMEIIAIEVSESLLLKSFILICFALPLGALLCFPILAAVRWDGASWSWALVFIPVWIYETVGFFIWLRNKKITMENNPDSSSESSRMFFFHQFSNTKIGKSKQFQWIDIEVMYFTIIGMLIIIFQAFFVSRLDNTIVWSWFAIFAPAYVADVLLIIYRIHDACQQVVLIRRLHNKALAALDMELQELELMEERIKEEINLTSGGHTDLIEQLNKKLEETLEVLNDKIEERKKILESSDGLRVSRLYMLQASYWPILRIITGILLAAKANGLFSETWFITAIPFIFGCGLFGLLETIDEIDLHPLTLLLAIGNTLIMLSPHLLMWLLAMGKLDNPFIYSAFAIFGPLFVIVGIAFIVISCAICIFPEKVLSPESWTKSTSSGNNNGNNTNDEGGGEGENNDNNNNNGNDVSHKENDVEEGGVDKNNATTTTTTTTTKSASNNNNKGSIPVNNNNNTAATATTTTATTATTTATATAEETTTIMLV